MAHSQSTSKERLAPLLGTNGKMEFKREEEQNPEIELSCRWHLVSESVHPDLVPSIFFRKLLPYLLPTCVFLFLNN